MSSRVRRGAVAVIAAGALAGMGVLAEPALVRIPIELQQNFAPSVTGEAQAGFSRASWTQWNQDSEPDYYRIVSAACVDEDVSPGEVCYSDLDSLGRAGRVAACVTAQMVEEGTASEREDMSSLFPSGWGHNEKVLIQNPDGSYYRGYFYNRSHLLAKSLGGEARLENLICGTRTQNVGANVSGAGGMAYPETIARNWLRENPDGNVWYCATPVYEGSELLPRSVIVDVKSSDGTIDLEVEVFNTARGYAINYATGEFSKEGE